MSLEGDAQARGTLDALLALGSLRAGITVRTLE